MLVLALDTALEACSAAVLDGDRLLAAKSVEMARGHQERLAPLVAELAAEAGIELTRLERLGVTVGPGSFTGLRVGLAFAKGLAFALKKPLVGVGTLQALALGSPGFTAAVIDARRDQVYVQGFRDGVPATLPEALAIADAIKMLINVDPAGPSRLVGPGAALFAEAFPNADLKPAPGSDPAALAAFVAAAAEPSAPPEPLYLRAPDAKLPI